MKKKVLSLILILCLFVSGTFMLSACKNKATALNSDMIILTEKEFIFTGEEIKPDVTVKVNETIIDSSNYTVSYSNNIQAGEAIITVTAKEKNKIISGSASVSFSIKPAQDILLINSYEALKNSVQNNENIVLSSNITIPAGETLIIPEGKTIDCGSNKIIVSGALVNNGTIRANANSKDSLLAAVEFANEITLQANIDESVIIKTSTKDIEFVLNLNGYSINNMLEISNYNEDIFAHKVNIAIVNYNFIDKDSVIGNATSDYGINIKGNSDVEVSIQHVKIVGKTGIYYHTNFSDTKINLQNCDIESENEATLISGAAKVNAMATTFSTTANTAYKAEKGEHTLISCTFNSADSDKALDLTAIDDDKKLVC